MHALHSLSLYPYPIQNLACDRTSTLLAFGVIVLRGASYFGAHGDGYVSRFNSRCSDGHGYVDTYGLAVKLNMSADYRLHTVYTH